MKTTFEIVGIVLALLATSSGVQYFFQRRREKRAQVEGLVVYATLVSAVPMKGIGKWTQMTKIVLRVQEPDSSPREVTLRSRVEPGQKFTPGAMIPVVIDPSNPARVYPATPESAKRVVLTGSRQERRLMQTQLRTPGRYAGQKPPSGYQPPKSRLR